MHYSEAEIEVLSWLEVVKGNDSLHDFESLNNIGWQNEAR